MIKDSNLEWTEFSLGLQQRPSLTRCICISLRQSWSDLVRKRVVQFILRLSEHV